jgi:hypothetical protein
MELTHVVGETIGAGGITAESAQRALIRPGSAAKTEVNASGIQRLKRAKLFGDHDRRVIWEHDSAGAHANGLGASGNISDDDRSSSAGDPDHVVVLGQPETAITPTLNVLRQIKRMMQGVCRGGSLRDECEIKNGKRDQKDSLCDSSILMLPSLLEVHNLKQCGLCESSLANQSGAFAHLFLAVMARRSDPGDEVV